jgi:carbonic anhydrase
MCILDKNCYLKKKENKTNNQFSAENSKELEDWSYDNQEQWKSYPNYYSVFKTPFNIKTSKIVRDCDDLKIKYNEIVSGKYVLDKSTPYFLPDKSDNYVINNGIVYTLANFHFHNSSENTINSKYSPVEVHFVNTYTDPDTNITSYLVIGLLLEISKKDGLEITNTDYKTISEGGEVSATLDLSILNKLTKNSYYKFKGSLTVPPFNQNFNWNLFNSYDVKNIKLTINRKNFDDFVYYFINNKTNEPSIYNEQRYINTKENFLAVKRID